MEYKKMLHKMQDEKNRKGNKLCGFRLDFLFVFNQKNLGSYNEDYFSQGCR